jgi:hypothetical protein
MTEGGVPFRSSEAAEIDEWSRLVYEAFSDWPIAKEGRWTRWPPGYLLLEVDRYRGDPIGQIVAYTRGEGLTVGFGQWLTHLPLIALVDGKPPPLAEQVRSAVVEAQRPVEGLLAERLVVVAYFNNNGKWGGSALLTAAELESEVSSRAAFISGVTGKQLSRMEIRTPLRPRGTSVLLGPRSGRLPRKASP